MSEFEDLLRQAMNERGASVRTAPDADDLRDRIRAFERTSARAQRTALVAALVLVAGSGGGVLGAFLTRPAGVPVVQADAPASPFNASSSVVAGSSRGPTGLGPGALGGAPTTTTVPAAKAVPTVHRSTVGGVALDWLLTPLAAPVAVFPGSGLPATCSKAALVSLTVGGATPVASGSAVVGLPSLQPGGLAVAASGSFAGADGHSGGWWAVLDGGSTATLVAVQFPDGDVVRAPVSTDGVAVLASMAPAGTNVDSYSQYASAVAEGPSRTVGSLEFLIGGGVAAVDATSPTGAGSGAPGVCTLAPALSAAAGAGGTGGTGAEGGLGNASGPPAPLMAAGDVVAAYAQAYDVDPLLGLNWNFSAVQLGTSSGCPVESVVLSSSGAVDGLAAPAVAVEAVAFTSATAAVVVYRRSGQQLLETGTAALVDGTWKVGTAAYCADMLPSP